MKNRRRGKKSGEETLTELRKDRRRMKAKWKDIGIIEIQGNGGKEEMKVKVNEIVVKRKGKVIERKEKGKERKGSEENSKIGAWTRQ